MRRHAGAVILLGGWLLMLPHVHKKKDGSYDPYTKAPVSHWEQTGAFDTAAEGEEARAATEQDAEAKTHLKETDHQARLGIYFGALEARCVPAESVYPPQPSAPK